jgi:type IV pilus assembly protein PilX
MTSAPCRCSNHSSRTRQRGATLLVAMVMVLLVLMLAVVGMRVITLESRIAGNMLESQRLQEVAEGSLRAGERTILRFGLPLARCDGTPTPVNGGTPCFITEARADPLGLNTNYAVSALAPGFDKPSGYWYPRYIDTLCPKGASATAALEVATTGCSQYYEVNGQATLVVQASGAQACGPGALCLRSTVNLFIK